MPCFAKDISQVPAWETSGTGQTSSLMHTGNIGTSLERCNIGLKDTDNADREIAVMLPDSNLCC